MSTVTPIQATRNKAPKRRRKPTAPAAPEPRPNYLASMPVEVLDAVEDFDNSLCQAALDAYKLGTLPFLAGVVLTEANVQQLRSIQSRLEHELLVCFREVSSLRTMARYYEGEANRLGAAS